ncbi:MULTISPECIES: GGDEF domain-containing protein [unclassified Wenzhouxiangella]|uniref:GGDEF domain-containing protein n=1 Tax=unclassified Wenzhouxiangella TaxID=2613841 RepID=UPI000E32B427|nr:MULTISPECIES: GGDEF domain-containing protein [unclassified Wenzhouxiangella]RFF26444.1 GGDEF domain-containing protein [Wenzhouxiangella sp. 15181]RFP67283.1 GGDEF domain-containing protein [Wenzhouxiangella sp. 15190]
MLNLDAFTLAVVSALAALFMAVTMAGIYLAGNRERAIADWALAGLLFGLGHGLGNLTMLDIEWLDRRLLLALVNGSVTLAYGMLLLGVQQHLERSRWTLPVLVAALMVPLATWQLPLMYQEPVVRIGVLTALFLAFSLVIATALWRAGEQPLKPYRLAVAVVILINACFLVVRAFYISMADNLPIDPNAESVLVPVFFTSVLFFMALTISLSLMLFRRKEVHLQFLARHDALTGLLNRYSLDEFAGRELSRAQRGEHDLSLILLDLDNFKQVNDEHGHAAGDHVLAEAAARLREVIREGDVAFRVGGEEFLVLLPGAGPKRASQVGERLRLSLAERPFEFRGRRIEVSTSVGVVSYDPLRDDWERMLRRADRALYRAKNAGRNRVEIDSLAQPSRTF